MNFNQYGTHFVECEAILAAQNQDYAYLRVVILSMLPGERKALSDAAKDVMVECACLARDAVSPS